MFEYFIGQVLLAKLQGESNCDTKFVLCAGQATVGRHRTHLRGSGTSRDPNFGSGGQLFTQGVKDVV